MERRLKKTIKKCLNNERRAQFDLYHACFDRLMAICRRYKRNREDAVSLLNDGFLKVLLNLDSYDFKREFFPWVSTIMIRTAIDHHRRNSTYIEETDFAETDDEFEKMIFNDAYRNVIEQLSESEIREMIFQLPEHERVVFNLHEVEGYQHREIAEQLDVSERTAKRRLKAAKEKLKNMLEKRHAKLKKVI